MIEESFFKREEISGPGAVSSFQQSGLDLIVLRSMAYKLGVTLRALQQSTTASLPLSYSFEERRGRAHRMIIYAPQELLTRPILQFVGFVSKRSAQADKQTIEKIFSADQAMLCEIMRISGLLSYSSLELRPGNWYNLVVFYDVAVKVHIKTLEVHRHAAYQLSPAYYEWIRLHNGSLPGGLACLDFRVSSTKKYLFAQNYPFSTLHEYTYDELYQRLT